jgi:hypothetical protein
MKKYISNTQHPYYVYVYLDPRIRGCFNILLYAFEYEPFYVGKGRNTRIADLTSRNSLVTDRINQIIKDNHTPVTQKIMTGLDKREALFLESNLINMCGRVINNSGPLLNIAYGYVSKLESLIDENNLEMNELNMIMTALNESISIRHAAERLGVSERTLYRRMKDHKITYN